MAAVALGAGSVVAKGVFVGAIAGGAIAGGNNISMQCIKKGVNKIDSKKVAQSVFWGAASGAASGGISAGMSVTSGSVAKSAMNLLVRKGVQAGANMLISQSVYIMQTSTSGSDMSLYGTGTATITGFISGATFNLPLLRGLAISIGLEIAGDGEEMIEFFKENQ